MGGDSASWMGYGGEVGGVYMVGEERKQIAILFSVLHLHLAELSITNLKTCLL